jgi:hypothetical protein
LLSKLRFGPVIPIDDPLSGIPATQEPEIAILAIMQPALSRDIDEQSPARNRHRELRPILHHAPYQLDALFQTHALIRLMRERSRHHQQHFVHLGQRGFGQRHVRPRDRMKAARKNPETPRRRGASQQEVHQS